MSTILFRVRGRPSSPLPLQPVPHHIIRQVPLAHILSYHMHTCLLGLPVSVFPSIVASRAALEWWVLCILCICQNHISHFMLRNSSIGYVIVILLTSSFLIVSSLVFPLSHLSIFISVTASLLISAAFTAHASLAYVIAGLLIVWNNLCFSSGGMFLP